MAWWAGIAQAGASHVEGYLNRREQRDVNRQNRAWQLEDQAWSERMSNSAYQRAMEDMRKAGLNPILASHTGGASTPGPGSTTAIADKSGLGFGKAAGAVSSALQLKMAQSSNNANVEKMLAEAELTRAQTEDLRARIPFSAGTAEMNQWKLKMEVDLLAKQWDKTVEETAGIMDENERKKELHDLAVQYHRLVNEGERLGLTEKEVTANFWKTVPEAKYLPFIEAVGKTVGAAGGAFFGGSLGRGGLRGLMSPKYPKGTLHMDPKTGELLNYKHPH